VNLLALSVGVVLVGIAAVVAFKVFAD